MNSTNPKRLTFKTRLKLAWEVLTYRGSHSEKGLSTFIRGYEAGLKDGKMQSNCSLSSALSNFERDIKDRPVYPAYWKADYSCFGNQDLVKKVLDKGFPSKLL